MAKQQDKGASEDHGAVDLQRRASLRVLGVSGVSLVLGAHIHGAMASDDKTAVTIADKESNRGASRVSPFQLRDVRLLDSPYLNAQRRNERYLLALEPDRLLHNFRINAGLKAKAPVYGGWESQEHWVELRCQGHTLGHYLSACSLMYASTFNAAFKKRADYIVAELRACQDASPDGLICAFPDGAAQLDNSISGKPFVGVPWYTMHKIFAGLRDAYLHTDNQSALQVLVRLSDWACDAAQQLSDEQFQHMLEREHGGMSEVLADVYVLTSDRKYLTVAERFSHRALLTPLANGRDTLDGLHSNTQIPKVLGFSRLHDLTHRDEYRTAAEFFWQTVVETRSFATGGNGDREFFFPRDEFVQRLQSGKTMETCCTHNMLRLTRMLFARRPSAAYADYYERALYNGILASQDPDTGMMTYFQATRPGYLKLYCTPTDSFWCCTGSGMENHAKYGESIYCHDADALYINLFIPSILKWRERGITVTQTTRFPEVAATRLDFNVERPAQLRLKIRHPFWCDAVTVKINDRVQGIFREPSSYIEFDRVWMSGDRLEIELPMRLRIEPLPGAPNIVAILFGSIVLAGRFGAQGLTPGADIIVSERAYGEVLDMPMQLPVWALDTNNPASQIKRASSEALLFEAHGISGHGTLDLIPYYQIAHERYNVYWNIVLPRAA